LFVAAMTGSGWLRLSRPQLDAIFAVVEAWLLAPAAMPATGRKIKA
jgi:hypothetical protein